MHFSLSTFQSLQEWFQVEFPYILEVKTIFYYTRNAFTNRNNNIQFRVGMTETTGGLQVISHNEVKIAFKHPLLL